MVDTGPYPTHEVLRHYRFLSEISGKNILPKTPKIMWRDQQPSMPSVNKKQSPYVVINPGSNEQGRRWPFKNYSNVADHLIEIGYRIVIVGGKKEKISDIPEDFNYDRVVDLTGKTKLPELLDVLNHAACVITNDTGPAHLSIALGTPTVVIVGGGHFGSFVPYPEEIRPSLARFIFEDMPCYHCFWRCNKRESKQESFPCVNNVSVDAVWEHTKELLSAV